MLDTTGITTQFGLTGADLALAVLAPAVLYCLILLVGAVLPGRRVSGYARDAQSGEPRTYRLNGLLVFVVLLAIWAFELTGVPRDWLWQGNLWSMFSATLISILVSLIVVFSQPADGRGVIMAFYEGRLPQASLFGGRVDVKLYLATLGNALLVINALSAAAFHYGTFGDQSNPGVFLYTAFWVWYVADYFCFERSFLYTFDIIEERIGFKFIWGYLAVYPYVYLLPLWGLAYLPGPDFPPVWDTVWLVGAGLLFIFGWAILRGANLQKYNFKRWPERKFLGLIEPRYIEAEGGRKILCSGFWGVARHFNYCSELFISLAMAIALGHLGSLWAWPYVVWVVLFFPFRQFDDDRRCAAKYGELAWNAYCRRTPSRIVPGIW